MTSWSNQFDDLKNTFVTRSNERLGQIETLLGRLQAEPANVALLKATMQHFHWLAGSGGTYGFDDITSWGTYGEELCDYLLKLGAPVTAADHEKLLTAFRTVEQLFAAQNAVIASNARAAEEAAVQTAMRNTQELLVPPSGLAQSIQEAANRYSPNIPAQSQTPGGYTPPPVLGNQAQPGQQKISGSFPLGQSFPGSSPVPGSGNFQDSGAPGSGNYQVPPSAGAGGSYQQTSTNSGGYSAPPVSKPPSTTSLFSSANLSAAAAGGQPPGQAANPNAGYPGQSDSNPRGNAMPLQGMGGMSVPPGTEVRTTGSYPVQAFQPHDSGAPTRVMGGAPLSSSNLEDSMGQWMQPGRNPAPVHEPRRSSRLAHIPTDKKFAVFADSTLGNLTPIKANLEERGLMVEGVTTASEAKGLFAERLPDVFIVGAPLIDNNGYELVEYLRGLEAGHKPIVIVLAQQAVFLDKVYAIRSGADAFFEYPSELTDLLDKLGTLLERDKNENYKVLSVDDDEDMANFIRLTLESAGYTVMHIADPKTFEEHFLSFEPDLVLLDVILGDMTGFEIAKYIRQNDRFAPLPIVFLTTQNKLHQHIRSAIAGGDEHLIKPVAPQLLIATVASRLERARSLKRLIDRDGLTRCLNFGSFMERAEKLAMQDGFRSAPAMMMIDVDNMKKINERMGFAAGDRIISNIANMLLKGFRNTDLIARFGNDQFAIVLEHLNAQQLQSLSSQVLGAISGTPQLVKGRSVSVTCSGGVSILEQGMSVQEWLDSAQDSLRKAKDAGGNRAIVKPLSNR